LNAVTKASSNNPRGAVGLVCLVVPLLFGSLLPQAALPPQAAQSLDPISLVFVVNRKNPVQTLSLADVRMMLLGERSHWPNGARVTVVMRDPKQPERDAVIRLVCRMDDRDYTRTVLRAVFTADLQRAPKLLGTPAGVIRFIFNVPGAIGYVRASEVDDNVKIVPLSDAPKDAAFGFTLQMR
jgi:ABC-type phosphate transport system substrate-binding protein